MITALIRTLSDSAFALRDSISSMSSLGDLNPSHSSIHPWSLSKYLGFKRQLQSNATIKMLPLEIISHIISYVACNDKSDLMTLLLLDKRYYKLHFHSFKFFLDGQHAQSFTCGNIWK